MYTGRVYTISAVPLPHAPSHDTDVHGRNLPPFHHPQVSIENIFFPTKKCKVLKLKDIIFDTDLTPALNYLISVISFTCTNIGF